MATDTKSCMTDTVDAVERASVLLATRARKMARSQHAYVRGSTVKFYEWLADSDGKVPAGPPVWICGDCHLGNLGPLADAQGRVAVQIRDLDQTVIGNPAHDLIRLALSLAAAARGFDLPGATTARMVEAIVAGYAAGLDAPDAEVTNNDASAILRRLLRRSTRRRWRHLASERIEDITPTIPIGKRYWPLAAAERDALAAMLGSADVSADLQQLGGAGEGAPVDLLDAAYWLKGCSSLGRLRYAVIARIGGRPALLDIKEATRAAAPRDPAAAMPRDNAVRVVTGARALSPSLGQRMIAGRLGGTAVVIRELMPQDLKLELAGLTGAEAEAVARSLATVVGAAHGRQLDANVRAAWRTDLTAAHSKSLDAPSWLWTSVVDLVGVHESAYLDHCRRTLLAAYPT